EQLPRDVLCRAGEDDFGSPGDLCRAGRGMRGVAAALDRRRRPSSRPALRGRRPARSGGRSGVSAPAPAPAPRALLSREGSRGLSAELTASNVSRDSEPAAAATRPHVCVASTATLAVWTG